MALQTSGPCDRLADDPQQLGRDAVQHRTLFFHPLTVVVDLARDGRHDGVALLCHGVVKAFGDRSIVKAEIAGQSCRRPPQIVRRERLEAQQLTEAGGFGLVFVYLMLGAAQGVGHRLAVDRLALVHGALEHKLLRTPAPP